MNSPPREGDASGLELEYQGNMTFLPFIYMANENKIKKKCHNSWKDKLSISCLWVFRQKNTPISVYTKTWGFLIKTLFSLSFLSQSCKTLLFFGNRNIESNNDTLSNAVFPNTWTLVYLLTASSENNCNYQNGFLQLIQYMIMNQMFYFMKHVIGPGGVLKSKLGVGWRMLSFWPRCFIMAVERTGVFWAFFFSSPLGRTLKLCH